MGGNGFRLAEHGSKTFHACKSDSVAAPNNTTADCACTTPRATNKTGSRRFPSDFSMFLRS